MNRLFIELYIDEDVDVLIADLVRARGFQAVTTRQELQAGKDDAEQLAYAVGKKKTVLTHNRADFEALDQQYFTTKQLHCGIIIAGRRSPYEIVRRLLTILNYVTADEMQGQLRYI